MQEVFRSKARGEGDGGDPGAVSMTVDDKSSGYLGVEFTQWRYCDTLLVI